jgi:acyl-CoA reductase-like NAD-dependent aldehyde dehydrogenase
MSFATTNPYTGEVLKTFPTATDDEVTAAIGRADQAFASWRNASFAERARVMQSAADILRRDVEHYAPILTLEMGKLLAEARAEVELSAAIFEYYADNAERLCSPKTCQWLTPPKDRRSSYAIRSAFCSLSSRGIFPTIRSRGSSRRSYPPATRCFSGTRRMSRKARWLSRN